ncbi:bifunctional chorismate synthase/riboflavin reductase [NAD(P)H] aro2 [Fusarium falciforme]|nr:bifunctional chorismate synthase/riboflavin reductase [NAD(P)H] aro2 [Fusarium falciforme]
MGPIRCPDASVAGLMVKEIEKYRGNKDSIGGVVTCVVRNLPTGLGGVQGGISNGENIYFSVPFKSVATISQEQKTATYDGEEGILAAKGRHDPAVTPRAIPIVEAMTALVLADALLIQKARDFSRSVVH